MPSAGIGSYRRFWTAGWRSWSSGSALSGRPPRDWTSFGLAPPGHLRRKARKTASAVPLESPFLSLEPLPQPAERDPTTARLARSFSATAASGWPPNPLREQPAPEQSQNLKQFQGLNTFLWKLPLAAEIPPRMALLGLSQTVRHSLLSTLTGMAGFKPPGGAPHWAPCLSPPPPSC